MRLESVPFSSVTRTRTARLKLGLCPLLLLGRRVDTVAQVGKKKPGTFCLLFFDSCLLSSDMIEQTVGMAMTLETLYLTFTLHSHPWPHPLAMRKL